MNEQKTKKEELGPRQGEQSAQTDRNVLNMPSSPACFEALSSVLHRANVGREVTANIVRFLADQKEWEGKVSRIVTTDDTVTKVITDKRYFPNSRAFKFPPNKEKFDQELVRAQNHRLRVKVGYHKDDKGNDIIDWVSVEDPSDDVI
jgi:hypothetical protein